MDMILNRFTRIVSFGGLAILLLFVLTCRGEGDEGKKAPDFSLTDLSGKKVSLSDYRGRAVLLDFWATWCPPCRKSIPELVDLQERYKDRGMVVLGISLDDPRQVNDQYLSAFKEYFRINYTILRADQKTVQEYFGDSNFSIPTMFVIDQEGRIVDTHVGFMPGAAESSLKRLL